MNPHKFLCGFIGSKGAARLEKRQHSWCGGAHSGEGTPTMRRGLVSLAESFKSALQRPHL